MNVVIAANGSFSPVHKNHILMLEMAKIFLEKKFELNVLGAYLTPTSDREVGR